MKICILLLGLVVVLTGVPPVVAQEPNSNDYSDAVGLSDEASARDEAGARERTELYRLLAQQDGDEAELQFRRQVGEKMRAQQSEQRRKRKYLEQFRLLKLLELLDLDEQQEIEFISSFTRLRRDLRQMDGERERIMQKLGDGLEGGDMPDAEINRMIDDLLRIDTEKRRLSDQFLHDSRKYLSAQQVAKFVLFRERFEYELLEQVRCFRERSRKPGRPGDAFDEP